MSHWLNLTSVKTQDGGRMPYWIITNCQLPQVGGLSSDFHQIWSSRRISWEV